MTVFPEQVVHGRLTNSDMRLISITEDGGIVRHRFRDRKLELFLWTRRGSFFGYELHYRINTPEEWSVRWTNKEGTSFHRVQRGTEATELMYVPIFNEFPPIGDLYAEFLVRASSLDEPFRNFVLRHLSTLLKGLR